MNVSRLSKRLITLSMLCSAVLLATYFMANSLPLNHKAAIEYLSSLGWSTEYISRETSSLDDGSPLNGTSIYHNIDTPIVTPFASPLLSGVLRLSANTHYTILQVELSETVFEDTPYGSGHLIAYVLMDKTEVICCRLYWLGELSPDYLRNEGFFWPYEYSFSPLNIPENYCPATWSLIEVHNFYSNLIVNQVLKS